MIKNDEKNNSNNLSNVTNGSSPLIPGVPSVPSIPIPDASFIKKHENSKYSGLSNQGSTCYLNSLVQSLFMTPEFRINLLNWKYDEQAHGLKKDCIPFQLQKLFARLELRLRFSEETKGLTQSFQWDSSEVFFQHDIQELCRKLFEAIELSLGPEDYNFINDLYEGSSISVVECQECNHKSEKQDKFLDLVLPIRNDFEKIYNKSLTNAIYNFLKPELLSKENKYFCEKCDKKVDAQKYMKFNSLPKILFISMSRFEYDYTNDCRKKINDKVPFPLLLNFNNFLNNNFSEIKYDPDEEENEDKCLLINEDSYHETIYNDKIKEYLKDGPNIYELFSIVIHSGTANGGHYYAYIKSFEDGKWYNFNDSTVSEINILDIKKCFGSISDSRFISSTTGYVLMYKKKKEDIINNFASFINNELRKDIDDEIKKMEEEEKVWKEKLQTMTMRIYYNGVQKEIKAQKTDTVKKFKLSILKEFGLSNEHDTNIEDIRVRCFNQNLKKPLEFYHDEDLTLDAASIMSYKSYTLEFRDIITGKFTEYNPDIISLRLFVWKDSYEGKGEDELDYECIKISNKESLSTLKKRICDLYGFNYFITPLYIFRKVEISSNNFSIVELSNKDMNSQLFMCAILDETKIFTEIKNFEHDYQSKFYQIISENLLNVLVKFNYPVSHINLQSVSCRDYKMDKEINVKRTASMKYVKELIADYLKLTPDTFIMKKYTHNGSEIKNLNETIVDVNNGNCSNILIYLEYGNPSKVNEVKINVVLCEYDYSVFKLFPYKTTEIAIKNINTNMTIGYLKAELIEEIKKTKNSFSDLTDYSFILIRESVTGRPARIFSDDLVIKDLNFTDNKKILIQEYKREILNFKSEDIQVIIRFWDVENWNLTEPIEIIIKKGIKLNELAYMISNYFPYILVENLELYRIVNGYNLYMDDINKFEFIKVYEKSDCLVESYPFFLINHGNLLM